MKKLTLLIVSICLFGCGKEEKDEEYAPVSCTATETDTIAAGTDISVDFSVNNRTLNYIISNSTCAGAPNGQTGSDNPVSAVRVGNNLTLTDSDGDTLPLTLSGTTINQGTDSASIPGCSISVVYNGSLDLGTDTITLVAVMTITQSAAGACGGLVKPTPRSEKPDFQRQMFWD